MLEASSANPFFIVGAQRSGTTMLRLMLNQHSRLCVPFESVFIPTFYRRLTEFGYLGQTANMQRLLDEIAADPWVIKGKLIPDKSSVLGRSPRDYAELVDAIFTTLASSQGKTRWGDKTPTYVLDIDVLWDMFPGCRIVHLVRDGRDVAQSLRHLSWGSRNLLKTAADWRWKVMLGRKMGRMIPDNYLEIRYEDLVTNPEATLRVICDHLGGITFEREMLNYSDTAKDSMPEASLRWHLSSVSKPDKSKVLQWKERLSVNDQILFDEVAGDALELFGYERAAHKPNLGTKIRRARYALLGYA
jgi:hypothetical protein